MNVQEFVSRKFDVIKIKEEITKGNKKAGDYIIDIISGSHGRYQGPVFCEYLEITPKQMGLSRFVSNGEQESKYVNYVELADRYDLDVEMFDPFIYHSERIHKIEEELLKQLGKTIRIDVLEADNSIGIFLEKLSNTIN